MIITIYAKERGSAPADDPHQPSTIIVHYDVPIMPPTPLQTGLKIRILELIPSPTPPLPTGEHAPPHYTVQETGVVGTIEAIRSMEERITEFAVRNDNDQSPASYAYVAIQHIPGRTTALSLWESIQRRFLLSPLPKTRQIPLEVDAVVLRNITRLRPERERRRRPLANGRAGREDDMIVESEEGASRV
ncbi:hypothetical protein OH77DRAFT_1422337 [Trametes cingulata]|nr:hypothetical protein OH77DRAFT_1422337 [Trametes cingulata]